MSAPASPSRLAALTPWPWLAALAVVTLLSLASYTAVQQSLRGSANDPQIQLAEDAAARLATGAEAGEVLPQGHVDIARSLAPWVAVARLGGGILAANADLEGSAPLPPPGVLSAAVHDGENRVTWQPQSNVRVALVAVPVRGRTGVVVISGRSLREIEVRVDRTGRISLLAWGAAMFVVLAAWGLRAWADAAARPA